MNINCIVDVASREVSFQENYRIAAYDHNVDVIHFSIEPIEDFSLDLSSIKIAAQGPNGVRHDYAVDPSTVSIEEETGYITFDWPIPAGVTEMPIGTFKYGDRGRLIFAVCAEIIDGSTVSKAWHSDDGIITVVAHLEPESGGGEDPSETATNAQKIGQLQTATAILQREISGIASGTPPTADSTDDMDADVSTVYINTTDGKWYYYDGSAWQIGGVYGGATTSTTFNQHGVPADDFAVGEALAQKADADDVTAIEGKIGDLSQLETTAKDNLVVAINEAIAGTNGFAPYNYSVTDNLYSPKFITNGYGLNIDTGDLYERATHSVTDYIPVTAGETLYASRQSTTRRIEIQSSYEPRICFYDAEKVFIENSGVQDSHATVPLNAKYMRFSAYILPTIQDVMIGTTITPYIAFKTIADDYRGKTASLENAISNAQNDIRSIAYVDKTDSIGAELAWTSGYVTAGGNIRTSDSYHYSELISVTSGDVISTDDSFRFVTAYVNGSAVESLGAESATSYTVPDTVTAVIVTLGADKTSVNHTYKVIFDGLALHVKAIEDKIDGATFDNDKTVFRATADSLTNGEMLEACSNIDNKKNDTIIFYANLDAATFGSVTVGHGYNVSYGASVTVDATKITIAYGTNADYYNANHGLTIDKFLMIKVRHTDNARADIQIETASGQFNISASSVAWGGSRGSVFALSANSTLTNVELASTFADFEQDIFLFGDSYLSLGDNARYSTVLVNNGYTNLLMDGYGGRNSANAMLSFRQVLAAAKPKFVIWALGMNDSDSSTAINESYKSCLDEVVALCETYGVTPILATIPNTPTRINTFKNTYIKSLGYRFIDFAKAVGAEESGSTWWDGMLEENDNPTYRVHPTALGAQALYARFLIDVPEIANLK